jgi:hypothetical protein
MPVRPKHVDVRAQNLGSAPPLSLGAVASLIAAAATIGVDLYLLAAVVPNFQKMFDSLGGKLPFVTTVIVGLSQTTQAWLLVIVPAAAITVVLIAFGTVRVPVRALWLVTAVGALLLPLAVAAIVVPILDLHGAVAHQ